MNREFGEQNIKQIKKADREEVRPGDIEDGVTVESGNWTELFVRTSSNTKRPAPGYGTGSRDSSDAGYSDFDLQSASNGAIDGNYRWVLYESEDHDVPLAISEKLNSTAQRLSVGADLTDKQLFKGRTPRAAKDRDLVLEFKANSGSDGNTVDASASNAESGLPYSLYRV